MNPGLKKLFLVEFSRMWKAPVTAGIGILTLLILTVSPIVSFRLARSANVPAPEINMAREMLGQSVPILIVAMLLVAGIVAADVSNGWLRSLLARPVRRREYLGIKLAVVFLSFTAMFLYGATVPIVIVSVLQGKLPEFHAGEIGQVAVGVFGQALTYLAMGAAFSCLLPGYFNLVAMLFWQTLGAFAQMFLERYYTNVTWLARLRDLVFPHRMSGISETALLHDFPWSDLLWGTASLALFFLAAFWLIERIQVDKTGE